ncbi:MAG: substrate-binding domain-containing protein [Chloroflexota bacterium]|nr:substrate-binding domain-containing protein [Chloroflexota bacterium]
MRRRHERSKPLYWQVADDITAKIDAYELHCGEKLPSERELCDTYEVSQITVRRALRELEHMDRVYSRHGVGWFVSEGVGEGEIASVVVVVPDLDHLTTPMLRPLARWLAQERISVHLAFSPDEIWEEAAPWLRAAVRDADALLLTVAGEEGDLAERYEQLLEGLDLPVLFLLRDIEGLDIPAIVMDEEAGMRALTRHILDLGHERLAYAGGNPSHIEGWLPYHGFAEALWEERLDFPLEWASCWSLSSEEGRRQFEGIFAELDHPTALVCASARRAAEALLALRDMRLRCPQDVAVVALGDSEFAPLLHPALTAFRFDWERLGRAAASMTGDLLSGRAVRSTVVSGELVVRDSCGANMW